MNEPQRLWWAQAKSDYDVFRLLQAASGRTLADGQKLPSLPSCQYLLPLQMASEKIAKAYFWRDEVAPKQSHKGFTQFLRSISTASRMRQAGFAGVLSYTKEDGLLHDLRRFRPLATALEQSTPALARMGNVGLPNLEYPWPHDAPIATPCEFDFPLYRELQQPDGRAFLRFFGLIVERFEQFNTVSQDAEAPAGVRERATLMLDVIASEGGPKRDAAVTGSTAPAAPEAPAAPAPAAPAPAAPAPAAPAEATQPATE